jgi:hypothetical protein
MKFGNHCYRLMFETYSTVFAVILSPIFVIFLAFPILIDLLYSTYVVAGLVKYPKTRSTCFTRHSSIK